MLFRAMLTHPLHYVALRFVSILGSLLVRPLLPSNYFYLCSFRCYRPSVTGIKLVLLAALSTRPVIISSNIRVISSMFFPLLFAVDGKKNFDFVGEIEPLAMRLGLLPSLLRW